jgi:poly-beta-hydroxyalkanoate depolymerase
MLYQFYETQRSLMEPFSDLAQTASKVFANPLTLAGQTRLRNVSRQLRPDAPLGKGLRAAGIRAAYH